MLLNLETMGHVLSLYATKLFMFLALLTYLGSSVNEVMFLLVVLWRMIQPQIDFRMLASAMWDQRQISFILLQGFVCGFCVL